MQSEHGDKPRSTAYETIASTQRAQERASTAAVVATNLLQSGIEVPMIKATTEASIDRFPAWVVPEGNSRIDGLGQTSAPLNDDVERFLMLLHRQQKCPPLRADIVSAFDTISELIQHVVEKASSKRLDPTPCRRIL